MRTSLMLAAGILGFGLSQGQVHAQVTSGKDKVKVVPLDDSVRAKFDPSVFKIDTSAKVNAKKPTPYLSIEQFYARRDFNAVPPRIRVAGFVQNYNLQTVPATTYSIQRWNGTSWAVIKSGTFAPVLSRKQGAVSVDLAPDNDGGWFRFTVSQSVEGSKLCVLDVRPQVVFAVMYRCPDWQIDATWDNQNDQVLAAHKRAAQLNALGFDTRISTTNTDYFVDRTQRVTLLIRSANWQERIFKTRAAAETFQTAIKKLVLSASGPFNFPIGKGLETKIDSRL